MRWAAVLALLLLRLAGSSASGHGLTDGGDALSGPPGPSLADAGDIVPDPVLALAAPPPLLTRGTIAGGYGDYGGYGGYGYGGYGGNLTDALPGNSTDSGAAGTPTEEAGVTEPSGPTEPLPETLPYTFNFEFLGVDFDTFVADPARVASFKVDVRRSVAAASSLDIANVAVTNLTAGSVVAEVVIYTPQSWSPAQVNSLAATLTNNPGAVFTAAFLASYPAISGFKVRAASQLPREQHGLSTASKIGIGAGAGGGGVLLLSFGIGFLVARRRRRMAVEPRNALGAAADDLPA